MTHHFTAGEVWAAAVSFVVAAGTLLAMTGLLYPDEIKSFRPSKPHHWEMFIWERDRIQGIAKGLGGLAVSFLTATFGAVLQGNIAKTVPTIWVVGCLLGVVGSLLAALVFYRRAERWARTYYYR